MTQKIIIAVDHGNSKIKTPNYSFPSSYKESGHLPTLGADVVHFIGKEYVLTNRRMPQKNDKTEDDSNFILTLFAIGKELTGTVHSLSWLPPGEPIEIILLVGLPPLHCKGLGEKFRHYFTSRRDVVRFDFNHLPIAIRIADVCVYPQAYAAAIVAQDKFQAAQTVNIVDIGGYTIDLLQLTNFKPDMSVCTSIYGGVNILFQEINDQARAKGNKDISDATIEGVLMNNPKVLLDCSSARTDLIRASATQFTRNMLLDISQRGVDLQEDRTVFVGGGSILLCDCIEKTGLVARPIFVDNIHANAQGYQLLYENRKGAKT